MITPTQEEMKNFFIYIILGITTIGSLIFFFLSLYMKYIKKEENELTTTFSRTICIIITIASSLMIAIRFYKIDYILIWQKITSSITSFITSAKEMIIIFIFIIITIIIFKKVIKKAKKKNEQFLDELQKIEQKDATKISEVQEQIEKIEALKQKNTKLAQKNQEEIRQAIKKAKSKIQLIKDKEKQRNEQEELKQWQEQERQEQIKELVEHFDKRKTSQSLEDWAKDLEPSVIKEAKRQYKAIIEERKKQEEMQKIAERFVLEHKAYPTNYSEMEWQEREKYDQAMKKLKKGELKPQELPEPEENKNSKDKDNDLFKKRFYHADLLKPDEREKLLKNGYRHRPFVHVDSSPGNNLIIKKDNPHESDYHFCMKHLFAELDFPNAKIEYGNGTLRADTAFIYPTGRIAIEIETGTNKPEQVQKKVEWLNENFDHWIFVCSRDNKKIYRQYVDKKKSFCLTLKEAKQKTEELIEQLNEYY